MGIKKQFQKSRPVCKVTFILSKEAAESAQKVHIVGDFNGWKKRSTPLKKLKTGTFKISIDLPLGREYQYRYLLDNKTWENDWDADKYVPSPYGDSENSVVIV